jgi:hypothetical protein
MQWFHASDDSLESRDLSLVCRELSKSRARFRAAARAVSVEGSMCRVIAVYTQSLSLYKSSSCVTTREDLSRVS